VAGIGKINKTEEKDKTTAEKKLKTAVD